jgi:hypothetical protein
MSPFLRKDLFQSLLAVGFFVDFSISAEGFIPFYRGIFLSIPLFLSRCQYRNQRIVLPLA